MTDGIILLHWILYYYYYYWLLNVKWMHTWKHTAVAFAAGACVDVDLLCGGAFRSVEVGDVFGSLHECIDKAILECFSFDYYDLLIIRCECDGEKREHS